MITFPLYAYVGLVYRFASLDRSAEILKINLDDGKVLGRRWLPAPIYDITTGHPKDEGFRQCGARGVVCSDDRNTVRAGDPGANRSARACAGPGSGCPRIALWKNLNPEGLALLAHWQKQGPLVPGARDDRAEICP